MKIKILALGKNVPAWVQQGYLEYNKRLSTYIKLEFIEIPLNKRHKNSDIHRLMALESKQMQSYIQPDDCVIALDVKGKHWDTEQLAEQLKHWHEQNYTIVFLIGGPEGLHSNSLSMAHQRWSLSCLTFPNPLVRIILIEQLYRAWSIITGHPYHRSD